MASMNSIWKSNISTKTKTRLVKSLIRPVMMYGSDLRTLDCRTKQKITAFELWYYRTLLNPATINLTTRHKTTQDAKDHHTTKNILHRHVVPAEGLTSHLPHHRELQWQTHRTHGGP